MSKARERGRACHRRLASRARRRPCRRKPPGDLGRTVGRGFVDDDELIDEAQRPKAGFDDRRPVVRDDKAAEFAADRGGKRGGARPLAAFLIPWIAERGPCCARVGEAEEPVALPIPAPAAVVADGAIYPSASAAAGAGTGSPSGSSASPTRAIWGPRSAIQGIRKAASGRAPAALATPGRGKLSGFVISYNRAPIIETCLRSLRFVDELIVVDKSSTDGTAEIDQGLRRQGRRRALNVSPR